MKINPLWQSGALREVQSCCALGCNLSPPPRMWDHFSRMLLGGKRVRERGKLQCFWPPHPGPLPRSEAVHFGRWHNREGDGTKFVQHKRNVLRANDSSRQPAVVQGIACAQDTEPSSP
jgi:hypothetical protein